MSPGWSSPSRQPHRFLWMALSGSGQMDLAGRRYDIRPGLLFAGRLDQRRLRLHEPIADCSFQWCSFHLENLPELPACPRLVDRELFDACFGRLVAAFRREGPRAAATIHWLRAIVQQLLEDNPPGSEGAEDALAPLRRICEAIDADPGRAWSVAHLAAQAACSPGYFSRQFKALVGRSPRAYLSAARVHAAQDLLRDSSLAIAAIAERLGYGDIYHFSKHFRQLVGCSPTAWRRAQLA